MNKIDYYTLGSAQNYFLGQGYEHMEVPWMVDDQASDATKPIWADNAKVQPFDKTLVASGEQSFIDMMVKRQQVYDKAFCITPCFRVEKEPHKFHLPYFMKLELIKRTDVNFSGLMDMLHDVMHFFDDYLPGGRGSGFNPFYKVVELGPNTFDLVGRKSGIEIGSYGIRQYQDFSWVYGTGVALPRLSQVLEAEDQ